MPANVDRVMAMAGEAPVARHRWAGRGQAPLGYTRGMAVAFAASCAALGEGEAFAAAVAAPCRDDPDHDVLAWYAGPLRDAGLVLDGPADRLVAVFAVLLGLGMRESSGRHCEGRDRAAHNEAAETAEAGLFQVSWNTMSASPLLRGLFAKYRGRDDLLPVFSEGVRCSPDSWTNWGEGPGVAFQELTKRCPEYAVLHAALVLRHRRRHWGPVNNEDVEVSPKAADLFGAIRAIA